eukprot:3520168-Pyramimonas_sp.AAC.1
MCREHSEEEEEEGMRMRVMTHQASDLAGFLTHFKCSAVGSSRLHCARMNYMVGFAQGMHTWVTTCLKVSVHHACMMSAILVTVLSWSVSPTRNHAGSLCETLHDKTCARPIRVRMMRWRGEEVKEELSHWSSRSEGPKGRLQRSRRQSDIVPMLSAPSCCQSPTQSASLWPRGDPPLRLARRRAE